ncbi:hypothetical protein FIU97_17230 [Roseivivax sp. THAF40]|uniref:hypothetical protein n=1 Tax=unclassified Roseivivax TaxID=2639302 RepID=UPI00126868B8|nr:MULTISPECIES: hypothetical protein [unclassified Roseivivax]QFS84502.1 hypothetical protein FIV09_16815 [Roseivivax sp. THAF197b]QFT48330.1 hypothetical protein FIU97_17230 [Roseivivax sp. THAF40]
MSDLTCNYQRMLTKAKAQQARSEGACRECLVTEAELQLAGETLEVCGEEFAYDLETGERVLVPVPLCPACHAKAHQDGHGHHLPCQIKARFSRETDLILTS